MPRLTRSEPKVSDLQPLPSNPREISDEKFNMLGKSMKEFGDLSGIVYNIKTGHIIGGHQRLKHFDLNWPIEKKPFKDKLGTVAVGHIKTPWGNWLYREVSWAQNREAAANIAANKHGGSWDNLKLIDIISDLEINGFDIELLGYSDEEFRNLVPSEVLVRDEQGEPQPPAPLIKIGVPAGVWFDSQEVIRKEISQICGRYGCSVEYPE